MIRMEIANPTMRAGDIAARIGVRPSFYSVLKTSALYRKLHAEYLNGYYKKLDEKAEYNLDLERANLQVLVPQAFATLAAQLMQDKDLRVQNKAANDILDREGNFPKIRRKEAVKGEQPNAAGMEDNNVAGALIDALKTVGGSPSSSASISDPPITSKPQ